MFLLVIFHPLNPTPLLGSKFSLVHSVFGVESISLPYSKSPLLWSLYLSQWCWMKPAKPSVTVLLIFFSFNSIRLKFNICLCQSCHRSHRMSSLGLGLCWKLLETRVIMSQTSSPSSWISATLATGNKPNTKNKTRDHSFAHWGTTGWNRFLALDFKGITE